MVLGIHNLIQIEHHPLQLQYTCNLTIQQNVILFSIFFLNMHQYLVFSLKFIVILS